MATINEIKEYLKYAELANASYAFESLYTKKKEDVKRGQAPFFNKISLIKKYDKIKKTS